VFKGFPSQACLGGVSGATERTDGVGKYMILKKNAVKRFNHPSRIPRSRNRHPLHRMRWRGNPTFFYYFFIPIFFITHLSLHFSLFTFHFSLFTIHSFLKTTTPSNTSTNTFLVLSICPDRIFLLKSFTINF